MTETQFSDLIQRTVTASVQQAFMRKADAIAEEMANDILRDPARRARFQELVDKAFEHALAALNTPADGEDQ